MRLLDNIRYKIYKNKVLRYTEDLCYHMIAVTSYIHKNNTDSSKVDIIKEAVSLIGTWKKVTDNVYKHVSSGESIEIAAGDSLKSVTGRILDIEIGYMLRDSTFNKVKELKEIAHDAMVDNLDENAVIDI